KREYIGIDRVIDQVVDAISPWYLFPDLQEKPVIINLWGLTGVGKSSLVNRLSQLIGFDKKYYNFDLGKDSNWDFVIEEIYEYSELSPVILAFDEFQHARTLDDSREEMDRTNSRIVWQLLDSGRFEISRYTRNLDSIHEAVQKLQYMLKSGVEVSKGKVISKKEFFMEQLKLEEEYWFTKDPKNKLDPNNLDFITPNHHETLQLLAPELFPTSFELEKAIYQLNGEESVRFLLDFISYVKSPKTIDCSKALIFVLGNLDEAYTMSHDFNPDMEADEIHEQSLNINVPTIKKALKRRFRNEQIARLGNI